MIVDPPLIWAVLLAVAVLLYVLLDGFDLGVGILFPFARSPRDRDAMMNSIAPVWDGNETWLVLGGGGLLAAFPVAYAIIMPALYLPIFLMLGALILRGVAFEFRLRARKRGKKFWTAAFAGGSTVATFAQGLVLGGFIQGIRVSESGVFAGGAFDWLSPYSILVACGLVAGYALLGAAWIIWRTEDELHGDARRWAWFAGAAAALVLAAVSVFTLFLQPLIGARWGLHDGVMDWGRLLKLSPIPLIGLAGVIMVVAGLAKHSHRLPFFGAALLFFSGYLGLAVAFFPYVVPYAITYEQAASAPNSLMLMLYGVVFLLPAILAYTGWVYWVFRGKVAADAGYH